MEQIELWKNITGTVCVLGLALTTMNFNNTSVVGPLSQPSAFYSGIDEQEYNLATSRFSTTEKNIYFTRNKNKLEEAAKTLFGKMRDATKEEEEGVASYVRSISKGTGVNFFDLC